LSRNLGRRVQGAQIRHAGAPEHGGRSTVYPWKALGMRMLDSLLHWFSPFRLMKDVSRGTREERIAAYRYNRQRRGDLAACMRRWGVVLAAAALLTQRLDALGTEYGHAVGAASVLACLAAACATFLVCGICVLSLTAYVYVYLTSHEG
jgi:hypothetical protein